MAHCNPNPPKRSRFFPAKLYQDMSDDLHLAGTGENTRKANLRAVRHLADHCETRPDKISETQLRRYFLYL
ncbi:MAG: phage integrase N-terminal SAM-like domain-containing protein, partial [Planctomycetota bacterium]